MMRPSSRGCGTGAAATGAGAGAAGAGAGAAGAGAAAAGAGAAAAGAGAAAAGAGAAAGAEPPAAGWGQMRPAQAFAELQLQALQLGRLRMQHCPALPLQWPAGHAIATYSAAAPLLLGCNAQCGTKPPLQAGLRGCLPPATD